MHRIDSARIVPKFSKGKPLPLIKGDDGRYWGYLNVGVVNLPLEYWGFNQDGQLVKRVEYVSPSGLFNDSVKTLSSLPITLGHPPGGEGYQLNRDGLKVGQLRSRVGVESRQDSLTLDLDSLSSDSGSDSGSSLIMDFVVDDERGVKIIDESLAKNKVPQISPAYDLISLTWNENKKSWEQNRKLYDHVALLQDGIDIGRGRDNITFRLDSIDLPKDIAIVSKYFDLSTRRKAVKVTINGVSYEVENSALANAIKSLQSDLSSRQDSSDQVNTLKEKNSQLLGQVGALSTEIDSLNKRFDSVSFELKTQKQNRLFDRLVQDNPNLNISREDIADLTEEEIKAYHVCLKDDTYKKLFKGYNFRADSVKSPEEFIKAQAAVDMAYARVVENASATPEAVPSKAAIPETSSGSTTRDREDVSQSVWDLINNNRSTPEQPGRQDSVSPGRWNSNKIAEERKRDRQVMLSGKNGNKISRE